MRKLWALMMPGMHIKRWLLLLLLGIVLLALSVAYIQVQIYRTVAVPEETLIGSNRSRDRLTPGE